MSIAENIARVRDRIHAAARRVHRTSESISLMAVTKTVPPARIRDAFDAGVQMFGENRVQEFSAKAPDLAAQNAEWHMIGHLQSNKARDAVQLFDAIDSIDTLRLAQRVGAISKQLRKPTPVLVEINIGGESSKSGFAPDSHELERLLQSASELALNVKGLMTVPPFDDDPEKSRPYFRRMSQLFGEIGKRHYKGVQMAVLSMGMSHDFEVAIEEGATCVRVGTAIFGDRLTPAAK